MEGFGQFTWADGQQYLGQWHKSKRHGIGQIVDSLGTKTILRFKNNKEVGMAEEEEFLKVCPSEF